MVRAEKFEITAEGEVLKEMPKDESNLICIGLKAAFKVANKPVPTLKYNAVSRIPHARGVGSSSATIVAGVVGGLVLAGHRLPSWGSVALLQMTASITFSFCQEKLSFKIIFCQTKHLLDLEMILNGQRRRKYKKHIITVGNQQM